MRCFRWHRAPDMSNLQLALQFCVQLAVILAACRVVGSLMLRIGQPRVIGEMIAGILLGPSVLGLSAPAVQTFLFPPPSLGVLSAVSQVGLVLYMFVVGMHLHTGFIRQAFRGAMLISLTGVVGPFLLGAALASYLYADGRFFTPNVSSLAKHDLSRRRDVRDCVPRAGSHHSGARYRRDGTRHAGARRRCRRRHHRVVAARHRADQRGPRLRHRQIHHVACRLLAFVIGALCREAR